MRVDENTAVCKTSESPQDVLRLLRSIKTMELLIRQLTAPPTYNLVLEKGKHGTIDTPPGPANVQSDIREKKT